MLLTSATQKTGMSGSGWKGFRKEVGLQLSRRHAHVWGGWQHIIYGIRKLERGCIRVYPLRRALETVGRSALGAHWVSRICSPMICGECHVSCYIR